LVSGLVLRDLDVCGITEAKWKRSFRGRFFMPLFNDEDHWGVVLVAAFAVGMFLAWLIPRV